MLDKIFGGIFDTSVETRIEVGDFLLCVGVAILLGVAIATAYMIKEKYTKSFVLTLALLPAVVCVVIMMVNGNIGAGVAVAGAFSLVRFRSAQGSAKEIVTIFLAMGAGLICGMGYLGYGALFTFVMCVAFVLFKLLGLVTNGRETVEKTLKITIPEDLDYTAVFDDIFEKYTKSAVLVRVKTKNMGSMFALTYDITLRNKNDEKAFLDELRVRNGNLEIMLSRRENESGEL